MALPGWLQDLGGGVHAIDTAFVRDQFDAAYLIVRRGRAAFVDTGTNFALPRLLGALDALDLARDAVDWVIPTHVHLDHAGGVGALMRELPRAQVLVHPRGARHLVDPSALYEGALAVYGAEEMARSYGELIPVPAGRVQSSSDGMTVDLGGSMLRLIDTPGHAKHHHCIWDEATRGWFTGDTFGISYPEFTSERGRWIFPTSTPVQFEPEVLRASVQRLLAADPACMYLTHYSRVGEVARLGELQLGLLQRMVELGQSVRQAPDRHQRLQDGLLAIYLQSLAEHRCAMSPDDVAALLAVDLKLNAQGIGVWLDREHRARG
jgi:glyoxylase-like metal-dependent hydrolase (beta-lactamase superfamily II)